MNKEPTTPILARYGETARQIKIAVWNSEEETSISLDNYSVTMQLYKPDGNFVIKSVTPSSGKVTITLDEQCTAVAGVAFLDLKISDANGIIYTCHTSVIVDTPVATDDVIESLSVVNGYIFPDDFQLKLEAGEAIYFSGEDNRTINARATALTEGEGITIEGNEISVSSTVLDTIDGKQEALTAGAGISISNDNVISTTGEGVQVSTQTATTSAYGYVDIDLTPEEGVTISPNLIISVVPYMDAYDAGEPICNGIMQYPIDGTTHAYAHFITGYNNQNLANYSVKYRVFYLPLTLVAEEKYVYEGGE